MFLQLTHYSELRTQQKRVYERVYDCYLDCIKLGKTACLIFGNVDRACRLRARELITSSPKMSVRSGSNRLKGTIDCRGHGKGNEGSGNGFRQTGD